MDLNTDNALFTKGASSSAGDYTEKDFETLSWNEHIRRRSGMYIGKLGDGSSPDDGIYILFKEIVDNAIDEFIMGHGKSVKITLGEDNMVTVRDYGRGIPLGKLIDAVSKMCLDGKPSLSSRNSPEFWQLQSDLRQRASVYA
jgi:hypothetical protein